MLFAIAMCENNIVDFVRVVGAQINGKGLKKFK